MTTTTHKRNQQNQQQNPSAPSDINYGMAEQADGAKSEEIQDGRT